MSSSHANGKLECALRLFRKESVDQLIVNDVDATGVDDGHVVTVSKVFGRLFNTTIGDQVVYSAVNVSVECGIKAFM